MKVFVLILVSFLITVAYNACDSSFELSPASEAFSDVPSESTPLNTEIPDVTVENQNEVVPVIEENYKGVLFHDDLETGMKDTGQNGFKWDYFNGNEGEKVTYTTDISRSGKTSLKFTFLGQPDGKDAWSEARFKFGKKLTEVYLRYYLYYPDGSEGLGAKFVHRDQNKGMNNKFFRMWDDDYFKFNVKVGFSTWTSENKSYVFPEKGQYPNIGNYEMPFNKVLIGEKHLGRWIEVNMHFKVDDGSRNGIIELYIDGEEIVKLNGIKIYSANKDKNYFLHAYFLGWSNSGFSKTTHVFMDDLVISDSPISE